MIGKSSPESSEDGVWHWEHVLHRRVERTGFVYAEAEWWVQEGGGEVDRTRIPGCVAGRDREAENE